MMKSYIFAIIISLIISFVCSTPEDDCANKSKTDCTTCLSVKGCAYCKNPQACFVNSLDAPCKPSNLQISTCFANAQVLAIILGSVGGVVLIIIIIAICCVCRKCKRRSLLKLQKTQNVNERQLEERRAAAEIRTAERNEKNDQIRLKYGLPLGRDTPVEYKRMS